MLKRNGIIALAFICAAAFASPIIADEGTDHVQPGSRKTEKTDVASSEQRLQLADLETGKSQSSAKERASERGDESQSDSLNLFGYVSSHAGAYHIIADSPTSFSFTLEDGSIWTTSAYIEPFVDYTFYYLVTNGMYTYEWRPTDNIVIQPNHWSIGYDYWLTNETTGVSIPANLQLGPLYQSPYKRVITYIDYDNKVVFLDDGTRWFMDNYWKISKWMANDTVIIGGKDSWLFSSSPNTLINVNMLNYAAGYVSY